MKKLLTVIAVALLLLGIASIESTPIIIPVMMILTGGAWLVYISNTETEGRRRA